MATFIQIDDLNVNIETVKGKLNEIAALLGTTPDELETEITAFPINEKYFDGLVKKMEYSPKEAEALYKLPTERKLLILEQVLDENADLYFTIEACCAQALNNTVNNFYQDGILKAED